MLAEQLPKEMAHFVVERHKSLQASGEGSILRTVSREGEAGLVRRVIFESLAVERVDFTVFADALVEALAAFVAEPSALIIVSATKGASWKRSRNGSWGRLRRDFS
jgi:hypothetical protein